MLVADVDGPIDRLSLITVEERVLDSLSARRMMCLTVAEPEKLSLSKVKQHTDLLNNFVEYR